VLHIRRLATDGLKLLYYATYIWVICVCGMCGFWVILPSRHSPRPEAIELKEEVETHSGQRVRDDANVDASSMCDVELDA
jgi:hypothetical protein